MKLSELSIADLWAIRNLCQEREEKSARSGIRHSEEYKLMDLLDKVAEELASRVVDLCDHNKPKGVK